MITVRRIYDPENPGEKYKVYIDRLWPRGISKEKAGWNEWVKEIAPSDELRKWFGHDPSKWDEFRKRYDRELEKRPEEVKKLKDLESKHGTLTLLYSARDEQHNNALALREFLLGHH
ncbi:MAG: DUF488 family protein [Bacteroidales bacterium]